MSVLSSQQMLSLWLSVGGSTANALASLSVAKAESGWDTEAISPSADYGLWQINRIHFGSYGINASNWDDPVVNARAAYAISSGGTNWAPWCTAWLDPWDNCGHGFLSFPQVGSRAFTETSYVQAQLLVDNAVAGAFTSAHPNTDAFATQWGRFQHTIGSFGQDRRHWLQTFIDALSKGP